MKKSVDFGRIEEDNKAIEATGFLGAGIEPSQVHPSCSGWGLQRAWLILSKTLEDPEEMKVLKPEGERKTRAQRWRPSCCYGTLC